MDPAAVLGSTVASAMPRGEERHASIAGSTLNASNSSTAVNSTSTSSSNSRTFLADNPPPPLSAYLSDYVSYPLIRYNDRIYLRDPENLYPLPCDLPEIHRQTLRTLMLQRVFGGPFCATDLLDNPPKRVLEVACGSGLWSNLCHEFFAERGHPHVSFTGIDIISVAPDLRKQGVNWRFERHDLRQGRLPFKDETFDFVFIKDAGMCPSSPAQEASGLREPLRVLKPGGVLETWDSDWVFRSLLPNPAPARKRSTRDLQVADATATYTFSPATPFTKAQNRYLQDYNSWIESAFDRRKMSALPCATIGLSFTSDMDAFDMVDSRRIAIPLGHMRWERDDVTLKNKDAGMQHYTLTEAQVAIRKAALETVLQMIEGLEPILMEASGKSADEWERWWAAMRADMCQGTGPASGECLEVSAWWARKK